MRKCVREKERDREEEVEKQIGRNGGRHTETKKGEKDRITVGVKRK